MISRHVARVKLLQQQAQADRLRERVLASGDESLDGFIPWHTSTTQWINAVIPHVMLWMEASTEVVEGINRQQLDLRAWDAKVARVDNGKPVVPAQEPLDVDGGAVDDAIGVGLAAAAGGALVLYLVARKG